MARAQFTIRANARILRGEINVSSHQSAPGKRIFRLFSSTALQLKMRVLWIRGAAIGLLRDNASPEQARWKLCAAIMAAAEIADE